MAEALVDMVAKQPGDGQMAVRNRGRRLRLSTGSLLFVTFLLLYVLTANGRIVNRDGEAMFQVARSLLTAGDVAVPADAVFAVPVGPGESSGTDALSYATETATPGRDGRLYSKYGLGQSLLMAPLLLLAPPLAAALPDVSPFFLDRFVVAVLNAAVTAATVALLYAAGRELDLTERPAAITAILYGVTTLAWPYARSTFSEPATGLGLLLCFTGLLAWRRRGGVRLLAVAGSGLGLAIVCRPAALIAGPALVGYALWIGYRRGSIRQLWPFAVAVFGAVLLILGYNVVRFGMPWETGYRTAGWQTPLLVGLYGLLLSPGKGIIWYNPVLFAAFAGIGTLWRRFPAEALAIAGMTGSWLLFHANYQFWEGGWSWGPRLLVPLLPFALLPLGQALERWLVRRALPALSAVGVFVQLPAVGADYTRYLWAAYLNAPLDSYQRLIYQPLSSPLLGQWGAFLGVIWNVAAGGLAGQRAEASGKLAQIAAGPGGENVRSVAVLDLSALVGINVPDLWFIHLYLFGGSPLVIGVGVAALAVGLLIAAVALRRRLAVQSAPAEQF